MTYLEQKIAVDTYANYLRKGYTAWIARIMDDYFRLIKSLSDNEHLGEVVENLYQKSYKPMKEKLDALSEKAATHNAAELYSISTMLEELISKAGQGL